MNPTTSKNRKLDGLTLFTESVLKPDARLRQCAKNQDCYDELMEVRQMVLEYLEVLRHDIEVQD
jgi:hypothetical protein